jgi:hypothetical protein
MALRFRCLLRYKKVNAQCKPSGVRQVRTIRVDNFDAMRSKINVGINGIKKMAQSLKLDNKAPCTRL